MDAGLPAGGLANHLGDGEDQVGDGEVRLDRFPLEVFEKLPPARLLGGQVNSGGGHTVKLLRRDGSTRGFAGSPSRVEIPGCHAHTRAVFVIKNLTRRPFRSFLAILGIGIGVGAVVGLVSLSRGFEKELNDLLTRLRGDVIIKQKDRVNPESSRIREDVVEEIGQMEGVAGVSGYIFQLLFFGDYRIPIYGFHPEQPVMKKIRLESGRLIEKSALDEVLIGAEAARNLGISAGGEITVPPSDPKGKKLKVVGVYVTGSAYQDAGCIVHLRAAQLLAKMPGAVMMLAVDVLDRDDAADVRDSIRVAYPELEVMLATDFTKNLKDYQLISGFTWAVSMIAVLVGAIGVLNTMLMSVFERTREIGMLMALGWSRARVLAMILTEGFVVSLIGGLVGVVVGIFLVDFVSSILRELPIIPGHDLTLFGQAMALSLLLGTLGSLVPAWKASRLSPMEALGYE